MPFWAFLWLAFVASVATFYPLVQAQSKSGEDLVPSDLSNGFDSDSITLQVSYDNNPTEGFEDGTAFNRQETSDAPTFALGDASGVNTAISFTILMVDTTSLTGRVLHYLQTDFQATEDQTGIASTTDPAFPYRGPGTMGETGSRQYTFLLFQTPSSGFSVKSVPVNGKNFDIGKWQSDNGLQDAMAGITMKVDCGAGNGLSSKKPKTTSSSSSTRDDTDSSSTSYTTTNPGSTSSSRPSTSSSTSSGGNKNSTSFRSSTTAPPKSTTNGSASSTRPASTTKPANSTAKPTDGAGNSNAGVPTYTSDGYRTVAMLAGLLVAALAFLSL